MIGTELTHPRLDAERWVRLVRNPSVHIYQALRTTMEHCSALWLRAFLEQGGLDLLVGTLEKLAGARHDFSSFSDAILQLDCVACVRELLNTDIGMRWMVDNRGLIGKLVKGLNTHSPLAKKHMFEVLTAICVYSLQGYTQLLDAFDSNKREWVHPSRFSVILSELDDADTISYRTTLMGLVNAIINSCHDNKERNTLRNEFISLQLLDILHQLRKEDKDAELAVQIQVFMEQKHSDEKLLGKFVDVNSHQDLFLGIYHRIMGSPESMHFLSVLQDLLWMYSTDLQSSCKWELIAKLIHQVACLGSESDVEQFTQILHTLSTKKSLKVADDACPGTDLHDVLDSTLREDIVAGAPGMDSGISLNSEGSGGFQRQGSGRRSGQRSTTPLSRVTEETTKSPVGPVPSQSLQKLKWVKLSDKVAKRDTSVWSQDGDVSLCLDFESLEDQFPEGHAIRDADDEVQLLSAEQSLSLNLLLSRVEQSAEELAELIEAGDDMELGVATLEYIMSCLPSEEEVCQLRAYPEERFDLGQAEQFLLMLSDIPNYHVVLETMTFRARLRRKFEHLKGMLVAQIGTCGDVLHSNGLKNFLNLVLQAGNFLNDKSIFSGAPGFKLCSLERLSEVKSDDPWSDLLTHLVRATRTQNPQALAFVKEMPNLDKAASASLIELKAQIAELNEQFHKLRKRVTTVVPSSRQRLDKTLEDAKKDLKYLQDKVLQASGYSQQMAVYFCEDEDRFDLQACLTQLSYFSEAISKILKEQSLVKHQCELATKRRTELEKKHDDAQCATQFGDKAVACSSFLWPQNERIVEDLLTRVHSGKIQPLQADDDALATTPSSEENPLFLSNIMASTPARHLEARHLEAPMGSVEGLDGTAVNFLVRDSLMLDQSTKGLAGIPGAKLFPKVDLLQKTHRRANSDLDQSVDPAWKWCAYQKNLEPGVTGMQPDSRCALASLGLEQMGRTLSVEDINFLQAKAATRLPEEEPKEKTKKRSSLGFFRRLSRRVLRTRNSDSTSDKSDEKESPPLRKKGVLRSSGRKSGSKIGVLEQNKNNEQRASMRAKGLPETAKYGRKSKAARPGTLSLENKENVRTSVYENLNSGSEV